MSHGVRRTCRQRLAADRIDTVTVTFNISNSCTHVDIAGLQLIDRALEAVGCLKQLAQTGVALGTGWKLFNDSFRYVAYLAQNRLVRVYSTRSAEVPQVIFTAHFLPPFKTGGLFND
jgi:hypothetical protein